MPRTPAEFIAQEYEQLIRAGESATRTRAENAVWEIVSMRCQKDMGGMGSCFTDCSVNPGALIESLRWLKEDRIADSWASAVESLETLGVLRSGKWTGAEEGPTEERVLRALEKSTEEFWSLDPKLANAIEEERRTGAKRD